MNTRVPQGLKVKGSQRWMQTLVRDFPDVLDDVIGLGQIAWKSPLEIDDYAEYLDNGFLQRLGITLPHCSLESFWPKSGPRWDALGMAHSGEAVIVEAKAHIGELFSGASDAKDPASIKLIQASLMKVKTALGAKPGLDWSARFYQYTNRLAHGYLLQALNNLPSRLVFVYFVGDTNVKGPASRAEWEAAIRVLHEALGLARDGATFVREIFIDVSGPKPFAV